MDIKIKNQDLLFPNIVKKERQTIDIAIGNGIYKDLAKIIKSEPKTIIKTITNSMLRGRGGAGFFTGKKWSFVKNDNKEHYFIINADESEPGSAKDRYILNYEPHRLIEGAIISAVAVRAKTGYVYIRGEYHREYLILDSAIKESYKKNFLGKNILGTEIDFDLYIHKGAGAYICGEETALIESMEGNRGMPRNKPPFFPIENGLYSKPTVVNNVETVSSIPAIIKKGANWFKNQGTQNDGGSRIFSISGNVLRPTNVEEKSGVSLKFLIENYAGGVIGGWDNLMAVIPGGASTAILPKQKCDYLKMDFDTLRAHGSNIGTGSIIVLNRQADIVDSVFNLSKFFMDESCGQCTPCREGTGWIYRLLKRITKGEGEERDIETLKKVLPKMRGTAICALSDAATVPVQSLIDTFYDDILMKIEK